MHLPCWSRAQDLRASAQVQKLFARSTGMGLAGTMRIEQWAPDDERAFQGMYDGYQAANAVDEPVEPPMSPGVYRLHLDEGFDHEPGEVWAGYDDDGAVVAHYRLNLPDLENKDRAFLGLVVHPDARRHGYGREMARHGAQRAAANGRTILEAYSAEDSAGVAFAHATGAKLAIEEVRRIQDLSAIAPGAVAGLRTAAERAAAGYSLVTWTGAIPEQYYGAIAAVLGAYNDAPHPDGTEDAVWDADRVRERTGSGQRLGLMRGYAVAAVSDTSGEMAGYTEVLISPESDEWGSQQLTAVVRSHRGHRLGLLLKVAMLEWLAEAEPQLRWISTGNAADNAHMIAVNEQLAYRVVKPGWQFWEMPVAELAGPPGQA
jgi:GNAT superfamily N-acetyltransferase